jgi:hypothetical protein
MSIKFFCVFIKFFIRENVKIEVVLTLYLISIYYLDKLAFNNHLSFFVLFCCSVTLLLCLVLLFCFFSPAMESVFFASLSHGGVSHFLLTASTDSSYGKNFTANANYFNGFELSKGFHCYD